MSAVPDPPASLSVVNFGTQALKATWLPPNEVFDDVAAVRYRITASADGATSQTITASSQEQLISGLDPGTMYTVQVCCGNKTLSPTMCACVLHACMCICMIVCLQECLHMFIRTSVFACICVSVRMHTCMHV